MKIIWIILIAAGLITVLFLAIINWNNSKVQQIVLTLPLGAIYAALIGIYFNLDSPKIEVNIPISLIVSKEDPRSELKSNLWLNTYLSDSNSAVFPSYVNFDFEIQKYSALDSAKFRKDTENLYSNLYLELLSFNFLREISNRFAHGWDLKTLEITTDSSTAINITNQSPEIVGKKIKWSELTKSSNYDIFSLVEPNLMIDEIEFPPKSEVTIKSDDFSFNLIVITNYTTTKISIRKNGGSIGTGILKRILNLDHKTHESFFNHSYIMTIQQETNLWRSQSLQTKKEQEWCNSIIKLLKSKYDYSDFVLRLKEWEIIHLLRTK